MIPPTLLVLIAVVLGGAFFGAGYTVRGNACDAALLRQTQAAQARYAARETQFATASAKLESLRHVNNTVTRTVTRTINKVVERPVYRNVCFDDDGVRAANAALGNTTDSGGIDAKMPPAHPD